MIDYGNISVRAITLLIIFVAIGIINSSLKSFKEKPLKGNKIKLTKWLLGVGLACTLFFASIIAILYFFGEEPLWVYSGFAFFVLLGLFCVMYYVNWYIILEEDYFIYSSIWGKKHKFLYNDVIVDINSMRIIMYAPKKKFYIEPKTSGIDLFIDKVKKTMDENSKLNITGTSNPVEGEKIRIPKLVPWLVSISLATIVGLPIWIEKFSDIPTEPADLKTYSMWLFFILLHIFCLVQYFNWYLIVNEDHFVYRNSFGKTYSVPYSSILS